jgi:hypothetical protein
MYFATMSEKKALITMDSIKHRMLLWMNVCICILLCSSCEKENWGLVSPPPGIDSIAVRFLNLAGDNQSRFIELEGKQQPTATPYSNVSGLIYGVGDSAFVSIKSPSGEEFRMTNRMRFAKNTIQTLIALPTLDTINPKRAVDTVIQLFTLRGEPIRPQYALVRVVFCANRAGENYDVRIGCPNGQQLASGAYTQQGGYKELPSGETALSLIRNSALQGIFRATFSERKHYTIIVYEPQRDAPKILVIDETNPNASAVLQPPLLPADERTSFFRVINAGTIPVDTISTVSGTVFARNLQSRYISKYSQLTACDSDVPDVIKLYSNGVVRGDSIRTSLDVLQRYTLVAFDDKNNGAPTSRLSIVNPLRVRSQDSASVRVLNTLPSAISVRVRLGARTLNNGTLKNGEIISPLAPYGVVTDPINIADGYAPITVLTNVVDQPEQFLGGFIGQLEKGKDYLLIIGQDANNPSIRVSMIELSQEDQSMTNLTKGVVATIVNAKSDKSSETLFIGSQATGAFLTFGNSLSTIVPQGAISLGAGSTQQQTQADTDKRILALLTGTSGNTSVTIFNESPIPQSGQDTTRVRCVNMSDDIPFMRLAVDSLDFVVDTWRLNLYADSLPQKSFNPIRTDIRPKRQNLVFGNAVTRQELLRPLSVTFLSRKMYSVIFVGNSTNGYNMILQQEF